VVKKAKQILRASNKSMAEIFKEFDQDGSGCISNLEFKEAFRKLGIGLTSREIDHLLDYCDDSGDGSINWLEFITKF
jgi:Ca2+-binding EF-hand superfamily protein